MTIASYRLLCGDGDDRRVRDGRERPGPVLHAFPHHPVAGCDSAPFAEPPMIALHIMTKEQSDWTFNPRGGIPTHSPARATTAFLRPAPDVGSGRRHDAEERFYALATTIQPPKVCPFAHNPYIELTASHPTNYMNCHHRAAWPPNINLSP